MRKFKVLAAFLIAGLLVSYPGLHPQPAEASGNNISKQGSASGLQVTLKQIRQSPDGNVDLLYSVDGMQSVKPGVQVKLGLTKFLGKQPAFTRDSGATYQLSSDRKIMSATKHIVLPRGFVIKGISQELRLQTPSKKRHFVFRNVPTTTHTLSKKIGGIEVALIKIHPSAYIFSGRMVRVQSRTSAPSKHYFVPGKSGTRYLGVEVEIRPDPGRDYTLMSAFVTDSSGRRESYGQKGERTYKKGSSVERLIYPFAKSRKASERITFELFETRPSLSTRSAWIIFPDATRAKTDSVSIK